MSGQMTPPAQGAVLAVHGIDTVINRVGHYRIGPDLGTIAATLGVEPATFFKPKTQRYWVDVPIQGISLELSRLQDEDLDDRSSELRDTDERNRWALHSVKLYSNQQSASEKKMRGVWSHAWPMGIDADRINFEIAKQLLSQDHSGPPTKSDRRVSFFYDGLHRSANVIELSFTDALEGITELYATYLGTTVAWPTALKRNS